MTTWPRLFATALFGASIATACVITTDNDDDDTTDETDGESGRAGRAGATSGRAGAGGTRAGSGGGGAGGTRAGAGGGGTAGATAGTGGSAPTQLDCSDPDGTPAASCEFAIPANAPDNQAECFECLSGSCCTEIKNCYATNPENLCGYGGPVGGSEFECFRLCLVEQAEERNDTTYTTDDAEVCAVECSTPRDKNGDACGLIGDQTNALFNCMADNCEAECVTDLITP